MNKVDKARVLFAQLESRDRNAVETARRNFEIHSRLSQKKH